MAQKDWKFIHELDDGRRKFFRVNGHKAVDMTAFGTWRKERCVLEFYVQNFETGRWGRAEKKEYANCLLAEKAALAFFED